MRNEIEISLEWANPWEIVIDIPGEGVYCVPNDVRMEFLKWAKDGRFFPYTVARISYDRIDKLTWYKFVRAYS